jgi:hypothetical protein
VIDQNIIFFFLESFIAFKRLKMYLNQPELVDKRKVNLNPKRVSLKVNASFTWPSRVDGTNLVPLSKKEKRESKSSLPMPENGKSEEHSLIEVRQKEVTFIDNKNVVSKKQIIFMLFTAFLDIYMYRRTQTNQL